MDKYLGSGQGVLEAFATIHAPGSKLDYEIAVSGYVGSSVEDGTAVVGAVTTNYQYQQTLSVVPVLGTVMVGPDGDWGRLKAGGGAGLYFATLQRKLSFADASTQAAFGQEQTLNRVTAGPHVQVLGDYFFTRYLGLGFYARYAYARLNDTLSRFLNGFTTTSTSFAESARAGNIAGLTLGAGLALRL